MTRLKPLFGRMFQRFGLAVAVASGLLAVLAFGGAIPPALAQMAGFSRLLSLQGQTIGVENPPGSVQFYAWPGGNKTRFGQDGVPGPVTNAGVFWDAPGQAFLYLNIQAGQQALIRLYRLGPGATRVMEAPTPGEVDFVDMKDGGRGLVIAQSGRLNAGGTYTLYEITQGGQLVVRRGLSRMGLNTFRR